MQVTVDHNGAALTVHRVILTDMIPGKLLQFTILHDRRSKRRPIKASRISYGQRKATDLALVFVRGSKTTTVRLIPDLPDELTVLGGTLATVPGTSGSCAYVLLSPELYVQGGREEVAFVK